VPPRGTKSKQLGLEASLWDAANQLRSSVEPSEYKHVVLGLIFLKYVSDTFAAKQESLAEKVRDPKSDLYMPTEDARQVLLGDRDLYTAAGIFWVPEGHRWTDLRSAAKQPNIGQRIDAAMDAIEKENPTLRGVLPKIFASSDYKPAMLGGLIDTFSRDDLAAAEHRDQDILGRVYEYFLGQFASTEGKSGEYYTPRSIVGLMVEMLEPFSGRVYDPACGSGGMFVQADAFVRAHSGNRNDISVFGQEMNPTTWRLAKMNLALRGIEANLGPEAGNSFDDNKHVDLRADFIITNPPFGRTVYWPADALTGDARFVFGVPPGNRVNYAWLQHYLHHLSPTGTAATVMPNGSLTSNASGEGEIRAKMVDADKVECVVVLPGQLFYGVPIPVCLWFLTHDKSARVVRSERPQRDRRGEVLFIDARKFGIMVDRAHRELTEEEIQRIADTYHAWRGEPGLPTYEDAAGFCSGATIADIRAQGYALTPGRYVGSDVVDHDDEPIEEKISRLTQELREGFQARQALQEQVLVALESLEADLDEI